MLKLSNCVCLAIAAALLLVHLSCEAAHAADGICTTCLNGEPTTAENVMWALSHGYYSDAAAFLGLYDVAEFLDKLGGAL